MKLSKKAASVLLAAAMTASVFGCGSEQNNTPANADISITIAARDGSFTDVLNSVKGEFEKEHRCTVKVFSMSADDIRTQAISDSSNEVAAYDIIMIDDPLMPEYIEKGLLCNLTSLGYADDEDFVEKSRLLGKDPYPLGATYSLPFSGNVQLLFYNKNLVDTNADLTNWNSILKICQEANDTGKKGYVIRGQSGNPIVSDFLPILWAFGGDIFDSNNNVILDSQESRDALEFYCKLLATGANQDKDDLVNSITSGEGALALGWPSWFISGNGTAAEIAQIPGKRIASSEALATGEIGNWLLGVTANSKNKELALELAIYLTSEEVQRKSLESGGIPTRKSVFRDPEVLAKYPYFEAIYSGTNNSRVRPRTTKWSQIEEVFGKELVSCINGEQTVNETIKKSQKEISLLANK